MERKRSGHENKEILAGIYFKVYGGAVILHHLCQGMSKKTIARLNTERLVKINHTFFRSKRVVEALKHTTILIDWRGGTWKQKFCIF